MKSYALLLQFEQKVYPHSNEGDAQSKKIEGETSWKLGDGNKEKREDSLEFSNMEATLIPSSYRNLCLWIKDKFVEELYPHRFQQLCR